MRLSLKAKLTVEMSLLVLLVVLATSTLYFSGLVRQALNNNASRGDQLAKEVFSDARRALQNSTLPPGVDPRDVEAMRAFLKAVLGDDPGLVSTIQSNVADFPSIDYVVITDSQHYAVVSNDPNQVGKAFTSARSFGELLRAGLFRQLQVIYGPPQDYEVVLPLQLGPQSLDVRVGISTVLLGEVVKPELEKALKVSLLVMLFTTLSSALLSFRLLRPLQTITLGLDRMARGEFTQLQLKRQDEWGALSSKLNLLGEQMRGEKAAFVALKENLEQLFANLADGLMLFDQEDRLVLASPAVSRFLGRSSEALLHRPATEAFSGDGPVDRLLCQAFQAHQSLPWRTVELPAGASTPRVSLSIVFVEEGSKRIAGLVTLRDASTRAQLEDQIDITTKLAALGRLTSGVAHEVKNPLNAMVLQLEILKSKLQDERAKPHLDVLSDEIRRLDRVVRTFLDFTRPVELHPVETDVESLVREVFQLAEPEARQRNVRLVLQPNGVLAPLRLDRDLIKQALLNLVINGCQAMPSGGELRVAPQALPQGVELEIADQGTGIPPEARQKIFSLYYTTKPSGTGVGLAMAYRIVQLHNGTIDFSSEVNRGTTFRVLLPLSVS